MFFSDLWFTTKWDGETVANAPKYTKSVAPCMTPEKRLLYQVFAKLNTHIVNINRVKFTNTFVGKVREKLDVDLRREVMENSTKDHVHSSADDILKSLTLVYEESIDGVGIDVLDGIEGECEIEADEPAEVAGSVEDHNDPNQYGPANEGPDSTGKIHKHMFDNPWKIGRALLDIRDVTRVRAEIQRRLQKKSDVRKCILNGIRASNGNSSNHTTRVEVEGLALWQKHTRSVQNNLDL